MDINCQGLNMNSELIKKIKSLTDRWDELQQLQDSRGWNHFRHMEMSRITEDVRKCVDSIQENLKTQDITKGAE